MPGLHTIQNGIELSKVGFVLALCVSMCGCLSHVGRESAFAVTGKILAPNSVAAPSNCVLELYRSKDDHKVQEIEVDPEFKRSFVIAPGVHEYYMLVRCPGGWTHKTQVYKLGSNRYVINPVDLGEIRLVHSDTH
jgi:hypothetical protein